MSRCGDGVIAVSGTRPLPELVFQNLGRLTLSDAVQRMARFQTQRLPQSLDEVWFAEHPPAYSSGYRQRVCVPDRINGIPVIATDRGGLMTYHGPGQLLCYFLFDLGRRRCGVRRFVADIEQGLIDALARFSVSAQREAGRPGIYVGAAKIGSLGLRVQHGCTRYGLAVNVCADLTPFQAIAPCGESQREMVNLERFCPGVTPDDVIPYLVSAFRALWS